MHSTNRFFMIASCLLLLTGVQLGALGSHALNDVLTAKQLSSWGLAVQYQLIHSIGLLIITLLAHQCGSPLLIRCSQGLMLAGIFMFSGNIYIGALGAPASLGIITPFGGGSLMLAWLLLAIAAWQNPFERSGR